MDQRATLISRRKSAISREKLTKTRPNRASKCVGNSEGRKTTCTRTNGDRNMAQPPRTQRGSLPRALWTRFVRLTMPWNRPTPSGDRGGKPGKALEGLADWRWAALRTRRREHIFIPDPRSAVSVKPRAPRRRSALSDCDRNQRIRGAPWRKSVALSRLGRRHNCQTSVAHFEGRWPTFAYRLRRMDGRKARVHRRTRGPTRANASLLREMAFAWRRAEALIG